MGRRFSRQVLKGSLSSRSVLEHLCALKYLVHRGHNPYSDIHSVSFNWLKETPIEIVADFIHWHFENWCTFFPLLSMVISEQPAEWTLLSQKHHDSDMTAPTVPSGHAFKTHKPFLVHLLFQVPHLQKFVHITYVLFLFGIFSASSRLPSTLNVTPL